MKMVWFKDYYSPFSECTSIRVCLAYVALMAARGAGGWLLPYKRLMGVCRWMGPPRGVLPCMGYIGMCRCEGYCFQAVSSRKGYINQSV